MSVDLKHTIVVIPGLNDFGFFSSRGIRFALLRLRMSQQFEIVMHPVGCLDGEPFAPKLDRLVKHIQQVSQKNTVSLIGTSAGGSAAFNALMATPQSIHKAVNVCGRLRKGNHLRLTLEHAATSSTAFRESVELFERQEPSMPPHLRQRCLTIKPRFGDEVVPGDTVALTGAHNHFVNAGEHLLSIYLSLMFPKTIMQFLLTTA